MSSLKRVLWISDYFPRPHDMTTGVWALETVFAIQKLGVEVVVLAPTPWIPSKLAFTKNLREWSNVPPEFKIKDIPVFYPKCPHYPHHIIRKYLYSYLPHLESSLVWHFCKQNVSKIIERYPFQAIHSNFIFPSGYIGLEIKKRYGIPLIVHERSFPRLSMAMTNNFGKKIYSEVINNADKVITLSHKIASFLKQKINNGTDAHIIRAAANLGDVSNNVEQKPEKYKGKKVVLSVGFLGDRKGHEYLVRSVNLIKDEIREIKCVIIGSGVGLKSLETLINKLRLNNIVELYGRRPHNEVLKAMSWCDIFVLPSWNEAFGTVYAEAMAFSKPIIGCEGEGISEVVSDGVQGLLVKKQDVGSLAGALTKVLTDENLARRLGREGRILAEKELNYDVIAAQIIDLYNHGNEKTLI